MINGFETPAHCSDKDLGNNRPCRVACFPKFWLLQLTLSCLMSVLSFCLLKIGGWATIPSFASLENGK